MGDTRGLEERVAVAQRALDAFNADAADLDAPRSFPDDIYIDEPEIVPFRAALEGTMYSGPSAADDFREASKESWTRLRFDVDRMDPVGAGVLAVGTLTGTSRGTGVDVESRIAMAVHVRGERISRIATHFSEENARRELGGD
jgi:ketosteroid isomerase-like protein